MKKLVRLLVVPALRSKTKPIFKLLGASAALVAIAVLVPMPTALALRDWSRSVGPWFPLAFLAAHVVVTVFPFPRTAFTLAAGLLFGTTLGVGLAVLASTLSALAALWLVRTAGWQLDRLVNHPAIDTVNASRTAPLRSPTAASPAAGKASATFQPAVTSRRASLPRTYGHRPGKGASGRASRAGYSGRIEKPS